MNAIVSAIYTRLAADATLKTLIAAYGNAPAIFSGDLVPENAVLPYVWISGAVAETPFDTKTTRGRDTMMDIVVFTEPASSQVVIETIAERVRTLLHRLTLTVTGNTNFIIMAGGVIQLPQDDGTMGRTISLRLLTQET